MLSMFTSDGFDTVRTTVSPTQWFTVEITQGFWSPISFVRDFSERLYNSEPTTGLHCIPAQWHPTYPVDE